MNGHPADALRALDWLHAMGADEALDETGVVRGLAPQPAQVDPVAPRTVNRAHEVRALASSAASLDELRQMVEQLDIPLRKTATQLVFSDGVPGAKLMLIGEAPGRDEDIEGRPFVGRAGQLLDKMLAAINLDRTNVYITNTVLWRPPGNRTPTAQETALMLPFVQRHIALAKPKLVVFLGNVAAQTLTGSKEGITKLRGRWLTYAQDDLELPALATLHPAYLLRTPTAKKQAWQDLQQIKAKLETLD